MKKLGMKIDDLQIESFAIDAADGSRGTVKGAEATEAVTCFGRPTCVICTRQQCLEPSEPGYGTFVNGMCIRC